MGHPENLTGQKFGLLTALELVTKPGEPAKWLWQCDCGNTKVIRACDVKNGRTKSCGCLRKKQASEINQKNLINKKFGKLIVIEKTEERINRQVIWKCKCECGNITYVKTGSLTSGNTTSCGCYRLEQLHKKLTKNLLKQRFGKLVVIKELNSDKYNNVRWLCQCDCGNTHITSTTLLTSGRVQSCGCLQSTGEQLIATILNNANIRFESQKRFETCRFEETGKQAIFDFYVDNSYIIEYDGKQHYTYGHTWNKTIEDLKKIQNRDKFKNEWCHKNNIPIIRIPYTHHSKLSLEDLLLSTSTFIIKEKNNNE